MADWQIIKDFEDIYYSHDDFDDRDRDFDEDLQSTIDYYRQYAEED